MQKDYQKEKKRAAMTSFSYSQKIALSVLDLPKWQHYI